MTSFAVGGRQSGLAQKRHFHGNVNSPFWIMSPEIMLSP